MPFIIFMPLELNSSELGEYEFEAEVSVRKLLAGGSKYIKKRGKSQGKQVVGL